MNDEICRDGFHSNECPGCGMPDYERDAPTIAALKVAMREASAIPADWPPEHEWYESAVPQRTLSLGQIEEVIERMLGAQGGNK